MQKKRTFKAAFTCRWASSDGKDGAPGKPGEPGKPGIPGLIERTSEWSAGVEFHNDENLTEGIRYLDVVTVTDNTTGKFELYQCRVTHTSTAANAPSDNSAKWLKLNHMRPIYTPLIVAKNAVLRFSQTNRILITNSKDKVQGCFGGVEDEANGYPLWIGAITAADAKFKVKYGGDLYAKDASIEGRITIGELYYTKGKTDSNGIYRGCIINTGIYKLPKLAEGEYKVLKIANIKITRIGLILYLQGEDGTVGFLDEGKDYIDDVQESLRLEPPSIGEIVGFGIGKGLKYETIWKLKY